MVVDLGPPPAKPALLRRWLQNVEERGRVALAFEEAENRLHAQKAILVWYLRTDPKDEALRAYHMGKVDAFLNSVERSVPSAVYHEDHSEN